MFNTQDLGEYIGKSFDIIQEDGRYHSFTVTDVSLADNGTLAVDTIDDEDGTAWFTFRPLDLIKFLND